MIHHAAPTPPARWWGTILAVAGVLSYIAFLTCYYVLDIPPLAIGCTVGLPVIIVSAAVWYSRVCRIPALREAAERNMGPIGSMYWTTRAVLGEPPNRRRQ